jgi:two-component system cell cycle sensor histidine kinase/response regulator CckA
MASKDRVNPLESQDREQTHSGQPPALPTSQYQAISQRGMLLVLVGPNAGQTYPVEKNLSIGRADHCTLTINTNDVSREHAEIVARGPECVLRDLRSRNGTWVNGVKIHEQALRFGDKVRIGSSTILLYSPYDELEDQLMQTQRLVTVGELAGQFAHDFRNLIAALRANIDFLRGVSPDQTFDDPDARDALRDSDAALKRATELTEQILGLARRNRRGNSISDASNVISEVLRLVERSFPHTIDIQTSVPQAGLFIAAEGSQLHQVVMNLCVNARDAMPGGGVLRIAATVVDREALAPSMGAERYVAITIGDTGCGMDKSLQREIFQPFFTTKKKGQGTGLGLSTCASIVRQIGGFIKVDSNPGEGSIFSVFLPMREPASQPSQDEIVRPRAAAAQSTRKLSQGLVLLIDDDHVFRRSALRLLESMGYPATGVATGAEGVALVERMGKAISLVLLDMVMPKMDGPTTFEKLQEVDENLAIVICSAEGESQNVQRLLAMGARGFLPKPFDTESLARTLSDTIFGEA